MEEFKLDPRLKADCIVLGKLSSINLLLMDNSLAPWFVLAPEVDKKELFELDQDIRNQLYQTINSLSIYLKRHFEIDKINIGAIGNIVSQLHVHVVGRSINDYCWPNVVWGAKGKRAYEPNEIEKIVNTLKVEFGESFSSNKR